MASKPLDENTPLSTSCPRCSTDINHGVCCHGSAAEGSLSLVWVITPAPGETTQQFLVFRQFHIYFNVSFKWMCTNYHKNVMFKYILTWIFIQFLIFLLANHFSVWTNAFLSVLFEKSFLSWLRLNRKGCLQDRSSPLINLAVGLTDRPDYQLKLSATWDCYWCLAS